MRIGEWWMGSACVLVLLACGGKAVVDGPGNQGGEGGQTTTTSHTDNSTTSGTGGEGATGDPCTQLEGNLTQKIADALACDPAINMPQCTGTAYVLDTCGCQILANELDPSAVGAAQQAYQAWVGQGCGPWDCLDCPTPGPGGCVPGPNGTGVCQTFLPD
jgi:hypothetical protein